MTTALSERAPRCQLDAVSDDALHVQVKTLTGRHNALTAELLAHLAEVDARGIYRERACSSLYTYCVYELRLSEDEAQRRSRAAKTARAFPILFEMLAEGAIHLTGLLLLAPHVTQENHVELLARARFRTKREIEHLVAELAPRPDVPARIEPLGPRPTVERSSWHAYVASLAGPVRKLASGVNAGEAPPLPENETHAEYSHEREPPEREPHVGETEPKPLVSPRYRVEFMASHRYVELLEEARNLLQHQIPDRDVARVHELAMAAFVEQLRKRRQAATGRARRVASTTRSAPERMNDNVAQGPAPERIDESAGEPKRSAPERVNSRYVPADVRRTVWQRDGARCTFEDANGRRCAERAGLELHHDHAFALGGPPTVANLRLTCRAHNALFAERDFGRERIQNVVERARNGEPCGPEG
jgi:hypothetical protein